MILINKRILLFIAFFAIGRNPALGEETTIADKNPAIKPDVAFTLKDTRIEGSHGFKFWDALRIGLRAGVASARVSLLGGPAIPYATLNPSPYATATLEAGHQGKYWQIRGLGTYGVMQMRSQRGLLAQDEPPKSFDQLAQGTSFFGNAIGIVPLARLGALAFFTGPQAWLFNVPEKSNQALMSSEAYGGLHGGSALALKISELNQIRLWFQGSAFAGRPDSFQNWKESGKPNVGIFLRTLESGAQVSTFIGRNRLNLGIDLVRHLNLFTSITPKASFQNLNFMVTAQAPSVLSQSPWVANSQGVAGILAIKLPGNIDIETKGVFEKRSYGNFGEMTGVYSLMGGVSWTPSKTKRYTPARIRVERMVFRGRGGYPKDSPLESFRARTDEAARYRLERILRESPDFDSFVKNLAAKGVRSEEDIIILVSLISSSMYKWNYNADEQGHPNSNSRDEIYERWRQSHLNEKEDQITRCIGISQVTSELVNALAKTTGINIQAAPVTVFIAQGGDDHFEGVSYGTHSAPMIRTKSYGIVFVESSNIIPTNTLDTQEALQIFQSRQGIPATIHYLGDPSRQGRRVGVIRSAESEPLLEALTYEGEEGFERIKTAIDAYDPSVNQAARQEVFESLDRFLTR